MIFNYAKLIWYISLLCFIIFRFPGPSENKSGCCSNKSSSHNHTCSKDGPSNEPVDEDIVREKAIEMDSPEEIARLRERDEWRDTHRTGWGNTYNRSWRFKFLIVFLNINKYL